jgi:hypothetical protein
MHTAPEEQYDEDEVEQARITEDGELADEQRIAEGDATAEGEERTQIKEEANIAPEKQLAEEEEKVAILDEARQSAHEAAQETRIVEECC